MDGSFVRSFVRCQQGALAREYLIEALGLQNYEMGNNTHLKDVRSIEVFSCSLVEGTGVAEGLDWLADCI